jgi:hypothetical protein
MKTLLIVLGSVGGLLLLIPDLALGQDCINCIECSGPDESRTHETQPGTPIMWW